MYLKLYVRDDWGLKTKSMIIKNLRAEFRGIHALISVVIRAWKAYLAYIKALADLNSVVLPEPTNEWVQTVCEHSPLSYEEALHIYKFITEETDLNMGAENVITEFVIDQACCGYRYYVIVEYLAYIDRELDAWVYNKLRMQP
jgi:hypothetical protein